MKRTATTLALLAGFGGGCMSTDGPNAKKSDSPGGFGTVTKPKTIPGVQGPAGEPVPMVAARGAMPAGGPAAKPTALAATGIRPVGGTKQASGKVVQAHLPGGYVTKDAKGVVPASGFGGAAYGPPHPNAGVLPVPGMGPPGAVAAVGAIVPGMQPAATNQRTSIRFTGPAGMKITWQLPGGGFNPEDSGLTAPKEYNFLQGQVYRLRLTQILPNFPGRTFYPTLEVAPVTPKSLTFLAHSSVPVTFTDEDFRQASEGNLVVKVIYLPDPQFQDFAVVPGPDEIVSTRLEPGADPVAEAQRRGTVLAIIRIGNIDLENRASPSMTAPPGLVPLPPGMVPPGFGGPPPGVVVPPPGAMGAPRGPVAPPGLAPVLPTPVVPAPLPPSATGPTPVVPGPGSSISTPVTPVPPTTVMPPVAKPTGPTGPITPGPLPPAVSGNGGPSTLPPIK